MAEPSALVQALAIPELLELILLNVDQRTLLISVLRVSKNWKELIDNSPALQKYLFFRPHYPRLHQLPLVHFPARPFPARGQYWLNPLLRLDAYEQDLGLLSTSYLSQAPVSLSSFPCTWERPEASLHHMEITCPPTTTVRVVEVVYIGNGLSMALRYSRLDMETPTLRRKGLCEIIRWLLPCSTMKTHGILNEVATETIVGTGKGVTLWLTLWLCGDDTPEYTEYMKHPPDRFKMIFEAQKDVLLGRGWDMDRPPSLRRYLRY